MKHILPTDLVNKVLTYLANKSYQEVFQLINEIKSQAVPYAEPKSIDCAKPEECPVQAE